MHGSCVRNACPLPFTIMVGIPSEEDARAVRPYRSMEVPLEFPMGFRVVGRSSEDPSCSVAGKF